MVRTPFFSVIIPTYNAANFLRNALDSVLNQTFTDFEIILVDNMSTDQTLKIIGAIRDHRIRVFKVKNEGVIGVSRNLGIAHARGKWVCFLDADDYWEPLKLESIISVEKDFDIICHAENWRRGNRVVKIKKYGPASECSFDSLLFRGNRFSTSAVAVRRELLLLTDGFSSSKNAVGAEDYHLWLQLSLHKPKVFFLESVLGNYTLHEKNTSNNVLKQILAQIYVISENYRVVEQRNPFNKFRFFLAVLRVLISNIWHHFGRC